MVGKELIDIGEGAIVAAGVEGVVAVLDKVPYVMGFEKAKGLKWGKAVFLPEHAEEACFHEEHFV